MNLTDMRIIVRRDLHDEDSADYRWTDNEINRHILHAVKEFSEALPLEQKATLATAAGSQEINIFSLTNRITVEAIEYPVDLFPVSYRRFALWGDVITLLGGEVPDGSDCSVYYGKLHTLDTGLSTIPVKHEDLVAAGAAGYAALEWAAFAINRVNVGGNGIANEFLVWGSGRLDYFKAETKRLGRTNRIRVSSLYVPYLPSASKTTDYGP